MKRLITLFMSGCIIIIFLLSLSCTKDKDLSLKTDESTHSEFSLYKANETELNTKSTSLSYSYSDGLFFYTKSTDLGGCLSITDIHDNTTISTDLPLGLKAYVWDEYVVSWSNYSQNSFIDLVSIKDLTVKPLIPRNESVNNIGDLQHFQPYNQYLFILGSKLKNKNDKDNNDDDIDYTIKLQCYDMINEERIILETEYEMLRFWIYDDILFFLRGELGQSTIKGIYSVQIPDELINNNRLGDNSYIKLAEPRLLIDKALPNIYFNKDSLIYLDKVEERNFQIQGYNYNDDTTTVIKEGYIWLLNVSDDWVYFRYFDENESIYRIRTDGTNEEFFLNLPDAGVNEVPSNLLFIDNKEYIIEMRNGFYHSSADQELTKIEE